MGLLDALFQGDSYGGQGGGLLDLIRNSQIQNDVQQNAPGFPQSSESFASRYNALPNAPPIFTPSGRSFNGPQFDPSTYAPNQAQPIGVGGYQMPRIGNADQFTPIPGAPPAAAPTMSANAQAPTPQEQPLPPALGGQPQGVGLGDRLAASAANFANAGGPLQALFGGISGLVNGQRTDALGMQQQNLKSQYEAVRQTLLDSGEDPRAASSKAMLAVMNPEAGKTILTEALTNKQKYGVISEDPLEGKKYGFINERDQTVNGKPIDAQSAANAQTGMAALQAAKEAGVTGDALYQYVAPAMRDKIKAMVEGRSPVPVGPALRNPATLQMIAAAHAIDPTFDETTWKARNEAGPDWTKGKSSEMVRAANQTLHHVDQLMTAMDNLQNTRFPIVNSVGNTVRENLGAGEQGAFRTNAHAVAEEMSKVFKGANLSDSEIRHWEQNLSENMSPAQQKAQIGKLRDLLQGSLQALDEKRVAAMGPAQAAKMGPIIKEEGQKVLGRIDSWLAGGQSAPPQTNGLPSGWSVKVR